MIINRTSVYSREEHEQDIPITEEQLRVWATGQKLERITSDLSDQEAAFLETGITETEYDLLHQVWSLK